MAYPFVFKGRQKCVTLRFLVQGSPIDPLGCIPERVTSQRQRLYASCSDGSPVLPDLHLTADQIIPVSIAAHGVAFRIGILFMWCGCRRTVRRVPVRSAKGRREWQPANHLRKGP
jgi:hypothetical protein